MTGQVITIAQQKGGSGKTTIAAHLAIALQRQGKRVAIIDTDPQGSLGRWFMLRHERGLADGLEFSTSSAWGIGYEVGKLADSADYVLIDTPPKVDSDLRPALRAADIVIVPIAISQMDLWATEGLVDLAKREGRRTVAVLNRLRAGLRLSSEIASSVTEQGLDLLAGGIGLRVAYADAMGRGLTALDLSGQLPAKRELAALVDAVDAHLGSRQAA